MARRTARQRAATRRLVAFNKSRRRGSTRRRKSRSSKMAHRRRSRTSRARRGFGRISRAKSSITNKLTTGTSGDLLKARGAGQIARDISQKFMPQAAPIAEPIAEFLAGGIKGTVLAEVEKAIAGQPTILDSIPQLGGLFGGSSGNGNGMGEVV